MIRRVLTAVAALAAVLAPAYLMVMDVPEVAAFEEGVYEIVPADATSACPGNLALPVGASVGEDDTIASGSDDVRFSAFNADAGVPEPIGEASSTEAVAATTIERVGGGDLAGLAAFACVEPRTESWLVGGSTSLGNSARLVLANPALTPTDVEVTIYGPAGMVEPPITRALGPESSASFLIEGSAPDLASLVIHVRADAGGVVAALQDSRLDGFLPLGTEWVQPMEGLATEFVVPGVGPSDPQGLGGPAVVRLFSPEGAFVSMRLYTPEGDVLLAGVAGVTLEPGEVLEVDLPASAVGAMTVESSSPALVAVRSSVGREPEEGLEDDVARDFAWVNGQPRDSERTLAVVSHYDVTLVAYATADTTLRVAEWGDGQLFAQQDLTAGQVVTLALDASSGTAIEVDGDVVWALRVDDDPGFLTTVEPLDPDDEARPVVVRPGPYTP